MAESAFQKARRELPRALIGSPRMWCWVAFWGLVGTGVGVYFSFEHGQKAAVAITVGAAAAGLAVAILTAFGALWATAPHRSLRDDVQALTATVVEQREREKNRPEPLRVALYAVRSELDSCGLAIREALDRGSWWNPEVDELPATKWSDHFASLSDPALSPELHELIETAYQRCNRLNKRVRSYMSEHKESLGPMAAFGNRFNYALREGDAELLNQTRSTIDATTAEISEHPW